MQPPATTTPLERKARSARAVDNRSPGHAAGARLRASVPLRLSLINQRDGIRLPSRRLVERKTPTLVARASPPTSCLPTRTRREFAPAPSRHPLHICTAAATITPERKEPTPAIPQVVSHACDDPRLSPVPALHGESIISTMPLTRRAFVMKSHGFASPASGSSSASAPAPGSFALTSSKDFRSK